MRRKMTDIKLLPAYFVIGGVIVCAVTYFGSHAKGQLAAFIAFLPSISVITLCTIYFASGTQEAVSYAKNMLILLPPWLLYVIGIIFLLPRIGLAGALSISVAAYLGAAFLIMRLT
jgi:uncharacterized membrane protein (GlpM family)